MLGGFTAALGTPKVLFQALLQTTQARDLTFIGNGTPQIMLGEGEQRRFLVSPPERVRKVICSFPGGASVRQGIPNPYEQAFGDGSVELELVPQGTLAERTRAAGAGVPAFYTPTGVGAPFGAGKEVREFDGRTYLMERWLRADFAFVKAIKAARPRARAVVAALQAAETGALATHMRAGRNLGSVGGPADIATGARRVFIA